MARTVGRPGAGPRPDERARPLEPPGVAARAAAAARHRPRPSCASRRGSTTTPARSIPRSPTPCDGFVDRLERGRRAGSSTRSRPGFDLAKAAVRFHALVTAAVSGGFSPTQIEEFAAGRGRRPGRRHEAAHEHAPPPVARRTTRAACSCAAASRRSSRTTTSCCCRSCRASRSRHDHSEPIAARVVTTQLGPRPYWELNRWMAPAGVCFLPATVIPVGRHPGRAARRRADRRAVPPRPHDAGVRRGGRGDPRALPDAARLRRLISPTRARRRARASAPRSRRSRRRSRRGR